MTKFQQARPSWDIDLQDLWRETLPEFDGAALEAKYARLSGRAFSGPEGNAFAVVERLALRFTLAERVLISAPMWNFGVPYKLKQWFDLIVQPGLTFAFNPAEGYRGLVKDRPTLVILATAAASTWRHPICATSCGSSASTACVSSRSGRRPARAIRLTPRVRRPDDRWWSLQPRFD